MDQVKAVLTVQYGMIKSELEFTFDKGPFFSFLNRAYMAGGSVSCTDVCEWLNSVLGDKFQSTTSNLPAEDICFSNPFQIAIRARRSLFILVLEGYVAHPSWREDKTTVKLFGILHRHLRNAVNANFPTLLSFTPA